MSDWTEYESALEALNRALAVAVPQPCQLDFGGGKAIGRGGVDYIVNYAGEAGGGDVAGAPMDPRSIYKEEFHVENALDFLWSTSRMTYIEEVAAVAPQTTSFTDIGPTVKTGWSAAVECIYRSLPNTELVLDILKQVKVEPPTRVTYDVLWKDLATGKEILSGWLFREAASKTTATGIYDHWVLAPDYQPPTVGVVTVALKYLPDSQFPDLLTFLNQADIWSRMMKPGTPGVWLYCGYRLDFAPFTKAP